MHSAIATTRMKIAPPRGRAGFTVLELLFSIAVIFLLVGLVILAARIATRSARAGAERQAVAGLKVGVDLFKQQFGFLPPLVKDTQSGGPLLAAAPPKPKRPAVYSSNVPTELDFLRGDGINAPGVDVDRRFSTFSLPYYIIGALREDVDGVEGPGFMEPKRDGSFSQRIEGREGRTGRRFEAMFDVSRRPESLESSDLDRGRVTLRLGSGARPAPVRYYRWLPDDGSPVSGDPLRDFLNVPFLVGDPDVTPELRAAEYAIVSAGPNGLFGDEARLPTTDPAFLSLADMRVALGLSNAVPQDQVERLAREDNIVEVGR